MTSFEPDLDASCVEDRNEIVRAPDFGRTRTGIDSWLGPSDLFSSPARRLPGREHSLPAGCAFAPRDRGSVVAPAHRRHVRLTGTAIAMTRSAAGSPVAPRCGTHARCPLSP